MDVINVLSAIIGNPQIREIAEELSQMTGPIEGTNSYLNQIKEVLAQNGITDIYSFVNQVKLCADRYNSVLLVKSPDVCGPEDPLVKFKALKLVVENFVKGIDIDRTNFDPYSIVCAIVCLAMFVNVVYQIFSRANNIDSKKKPQ